MKIKFCGIRRLEDVAYCNDLQPDYLGMILSEGFRRTVPIETAAKLAAERRGRTALVGVFVDETPEHIAQVLKRVPLDVIQLHGSETAEIVSGVRWRTGLPIWKAVRVQSPEEIAAAQQLGADRLILEGHVPGQAGGSQSFLLAGGLTPENVAEAVSLVQPDGVDFSSGIETDGVKDYEKMKQIVTIIRGGYHG